MNKYIVLFFLSLFISVSLTSIELTEIEKDFLDNNTQLRFLISNTNKPYEFYDGEYKGINIDIINQIGEEIGFECEFFSIDDKMYNYDYYSNFTGENQNLEFTVPIYNLKFTSYFHDKKMDYEAIENVYLFQANFLRESISHSFPNATINIYDDLENCFDTFVNDKFSAMIIDNFYKWYFEEDFVKYDLNLFSHENEITFKYRIGNSKDLPVLNSIIAKGLYRLQKNEQINLIFDNWKQKSFVRKNKLNSDIYLIFFILQLFMLMTTIIFIIYFRKMKKNIKQNLLDKQKEIDRLKFEMQSNQYSKTRSIGFVQNFNSIPISIDLNGDIIFVGQNVQNLLGYSVDFLSGRSAKILFKENLQTILNIFRNKTSVNNVDYGEIEINSQDGLSRIFIYNSQLVKQENDKFVINCLLQDITERKRLEKRLEAYTNHLESIVDQRTKKLRESEERFKLLVENSLDGIFLLDYENFVYVNDSFCSLTGYSEAELYHNHNNFFELVVSSSQSEVKDIILHQPLSSQKYHYFESKIKEKTGKILDVEINITNAIYNKKKVVLGLIRDITKKKQEEFERLERERLLVISQLAVTANDRINSPLNAISGYVEILKMKIDKTDPLLKNAIETIEKSAKIIEVIMKKLRSMTNITLQDYNFKDMKMFNLDKEIEEAIEQKEAEDE